MKKIFLFALAALFSASMLADTAILSGQLGENGATLVEPGRVIVGAAGSAAEGWILAMAGTGDKKWATSDTIVYNETEYATLKNSNGRQDTIILPEGLYASKVEFYVTTNDEATKGTLKEFDGEACKDSVYSLKDFEHPYYLAKELETPKNIFTFTFGGKQVCFIAIVTYSAEAPEEPKPYGLLSYNLGENGADLGDAGKVNSITGATGSAAEGWTIAMTGDATKNWAGGGKLGYKGNEYKTLKNSNGVQITLTLPEGRYATDVEFRSVTNDDAAVGSLKEFDGVSCKDTVFSLKDYTNPTIIAKELATPKNEFTFTFGGKQVCFIAIVHYTEEAPVEPTEAVENTKAEIKAIKRIENGQIVIIKNGIRYNALGAQL